MEKKEQINECKICGGNYPPGKHNFEECYSLDPDWDLKMINVAKLDQFYTKDSVAKEYWDIYKKYIPISYDYILEPSAGKGAFYNLLPKDKRIGIDLDPKCRGVKKINFFDFEPEKNKIYIVIGNPPFGRVSSMAIRFFNKCAEFAILIGFIIPRTFKRISVQNSLSLNFSLVMSKDSPLKPCCFVPKMSAKCCFQIWKKTGLRKKINLVTTHKDFTFLKLGPKDKNNQPTPPNGADFAMKAYGSNCGKLQHDKLNTLRPKSWHWISSNICKKELTRRFNSLDYSISRDTVRQDSIGKGVLIMLYSSRYH